MAATANSMSLSWLPPEKPNGIILDYEIKYHEKVRHSVNQCPEPDPNLLLQIPQNNAADVTLNEATLQMESLTCFT